MTKTTVTITPDAKMQAQLDAMTQQIAQMADEVSGKDAANAEAVALIGFLRSQIVALNSANDALRAEVDTLHAWKAAVPVDAIKHARGIGYALDTLSDVGDKGRCYLAQIDAWLESQQPEVQP